MSHLGDRITALVDGELSPEAAERVLAHLASCRPCRDETEAERAAKAQLLALAGPAPAVDLVGRLLLMGGPAGPMPPRSGHVPGSPRPPLVTVGPPPAMMPAAAGWAAPSGQPVGWPHAAAVSPWAPQRPATSRPAGRPEPAAASTGPGRDVPPARLGGRRRDVGMVVLGALSVVAVGTGGYALQGSSLPGAGMVQPVAQLLVHQARSGVDRPATEFTLEGSRSR